MAAVMAAMSLMAAPIDQATAFKKAQNYLANEMYSGKLMAPEALQPVLLKAEIGDVKLNQPVYYIYNTSTTFLVIAGDDRAEEILMIGDKPLNLNRVPDGLQYLLDCYKEQITYLQMHPGLQVDPVVKPATPSLRATTYGPLLPCNWDQSAPYYNQCVFTYSGTTYQCLTGCPATSAAQVMYYWKHPTTQVAAISSYTSTLDIGYNNSVNFTYPALPATTFDWANMLDTYTRNGYNTTQGNAVATLMRYVGQAEKMMYGTSAAGGSGIYTTQTQQVVDMFVRFGYDPNTTKVIYKTNYSATNWANTIIAEMAAGRPVVYNGVDNSQGGHAFNVDGYRDSDSKYHVNFGWSGDGNNWYAMNAFSYGGATFSSGQQAIIGIQPEDPIPTLTATPASVSFTSCYPNETSTQTFTLKGRYLTGNVSLSVSGTGYTISPTTVSKADAEAGATITVTYTPTAVGTATGVVTATSSGAENLTVNLSSTTVTKPVLTATATALNFSTSVGTSVKKTVYIKGTNLTSNVSVAVSGAGFSADVTSITQANATSGKTVTVTYNPTETGTHTGTMTVSATGANPLVIQLNGSANDDTPTLNVSPTSLTFSGVTEQTYTKTFTVTGANLTGNVTLALNDANNVYSISRTSVTASQAESGVSITVTYAPNAAGTHNATVTLSSTGVASKTVSLTGTATEPVRTITATPNALTFNNLVGETATQTFNVVGENLKGSNLTLTLNDESGAYSIEPSTITIDEATAGKTVTVTYAPTAFGNSNATITITGGSANPVTVSLNGQANLIKYAPVMLQPNDTYVALTRFRAEWTDQTPAANVESYTLEVTPKVVEPELLGTINGTSYTNQNYQAVTLTAPWSGTNVFGGYGAIYFRNSGHSSATTDGNIKYTIPANYENMTFTVRITTSATTGYGTGRFAVGSNQTAAVEYNMTTGGESHYWLVTGSTGDVITITSPETQYSPDIALIEVYSGDATPATLMATETGGANSRLIEGITPDTYYTVKDLTAGGTFLYRVKALYIDGTQSDWSNIQEVTLHENEHPYALGDVNHDETVDVNDVTMVIAFILGNDNGICQICADVNNDGAVDVSDVTSIIGIILNGGATLNVAKPAHIIPFAR